MQSRFVAQAYLYGDSLKSACVAIIVPDEEVLMEWAKGNGHTKTFKGLCNSEVRGVANWKWVWLSMGYVFVVRISSR